MGAEDLTLEGIDFERCIHVDDKERWNRHRNEPWCVVGEQRHWPPPPFGEGRGDSFFIASPFGEEAEAISIVWAFSLSLSFGNSLCLCCTYI